MPPKFHSPHEVAEELGVDVQTVRRWIHAGALRAFKPGKEYRIRATDLEEFLRQAEVRSVENLPHVRLPPEEFDEMRRKAVVGQLDGAQFLEAVTHEFNVTDRFAKDLAASGAPEAELEEANELRREARKRWIVVVFDRAEGLINLDPRRDPLKPKRDDTRFLSLDEAAAQIDGRRVESRV